MAAVFKAYRFANVANGSYSNVYTVPASTTAIMLSVIISNKSGARVLVSVNINNGANNFVQMQDIPIPPGSSLQAIADKQVVTNPDIVQIKTNATSAVDATISVLEGV